MKDPYLVLKRLMQTEKSARLAEKQRKYFFDVELHANKIDIRKAVETIYKVKVVKVNTHIVPSKPKTVRRDRGYTSEWKKAVVTLGQGQKIEWAQQQG